ncbi:MAG: thioredoxin family protein [Fluviicola sp.]|nr:thioredoxin family protein [Fluviicola sp.]
MAIFEDVDISDFELIMQKEFKKKNTVILKFGAELCDACFALESELEDLEDENENISVLFIDCNEAQDIAEQYNIQKVPTMIIYKDADTMIYKDYGVILASDIKKVISNGI